MKGEPTAAPLRPGQITCTLDPIRELGPACLDHHAEPCIKKITLPEVGIAYDDALDHKVCITADNLLDPGQPPAPIPPVGNLEWAKFFFFFGGPDDPHRVTVSASDGVSFQYPGDAECVLRWMERIGLCALSKTAGQLTAILVALAVAISPGFGDGDNDEDDPDAERLALAGSCSYHQLFPLTRLGT